MNVDDLRRELSERAEVTHGSQAHARVAAVHARIAERRRRIVAGGVTATALAVAAVALAPVALDRVAQPAPPAPATGDPRPERDDALAWPTEYEGNKLVASVIGEPGERTVTLRFVPRTTDLQWGALCQAPYRSNRSARVFLNGHVVGFPDCSPHQRTSGPAHSGGDGAENRRYWAERGVVPGEPSVLRFVLSGSRPMAPTARLGLAVWDNSGPRVTTDGVTVSELVEYGHQTYRLVGFLTQPLTASTRELSTSIPYDVDNPYVETGIESSHGLGHSDLVARVSGTRHFISGSGGSIGDVFKNAAGRTVTVRQRADEVTSGTLYIAIYAPD